jgi:hypothetical protein
VLHRYPDRPWPRTPVWERGGSDHRLADLLLIDAWTGLRWTDLRAARVRAFVKVPMPLLVVEQARPQVWGRRARRGSRAGCPWRTGCRWSGRWLVAGRRVVSSGVDFPERSWRGFLFFCPCNGPTPKTMVRPQPEGVAGHHLRESD